MTVGSLGPQVQEQAPTHFVNSQSHRMLQNAEPCQRASGFCPQHSCSLVTQKHHYRLRLSFIYYRPSQECEASNSTRRTLHQASLSSKTSNLHHLDVAAMTDVLPLCHVHQGKGCNYCSVFKQEEGFFRVTCPKCMKLIIKRASTKEIKGTSVMGILKRINIVHTYDRKCANVASPSANSETLWAVAYEAAD